MTLRPCPQEAEVRRLLELGHWPQSCTPELRAHVEGCKACGDLVLVTTAFRGARSQSMQAAQLPPPGVLWWRAQLRRRNAAVVRINKPLFGAQIFAFGITLLVAAGLITSQAKQSWHWFTSLRSEVADWIASISQSQAFHFQALFPVTAIKSGASLMYLVTGLAMVALISGVVLYLASEKQ